MLLIILLQCRLQANKKACVLLVHFFLGCRKPSKRADVLRMLFFQGRLVATMELACLA